MSTNIGFLIDKEAERTTSFLQSLQEKCELSKVKLVFFYLDSYSWEKDTVTEVLINNQRISTTTMQIKTPDVIYDFSVASDSQSRLSILYKKQKMIASGKKIFNSKVQNKRLHYSLINKDKYLLQYTPETEVYNNPNAIIELLNKWDSLMLKPIIGEGGKGIFRIRKNNDHVLVESEPDHVTCGNIRLLQSRAKAVTWLYDNIRPDKYFIQKEITSLGNKNSKIDFRYFFVKDSCNKWNYSGFFARQSNSDSIITDVYKNAKQVTSAQILREFENFPHQTIVDKGAMFCNLLSENDPMNILYGVDVMVDNKNKIWFLEFNRRPRIFAVPQSIVSLIVDNLSNFLVSTSKVST